MWTPIRLVEHMGLGYTVFFFEQGDSMKEDSLLGDSVELWDHPRDDDPIQSREDAIREAVRLWRKERNEGRNYYHG